MGPIPRVKIFEFRPIFECSRIVAEGTIGVQRPVDHDGRITDDGRRGSERQAIRVQLEMGLSWTNRVEGENRSHERADLAVLLICAIVQAGSMAGRFEDPRKWKIDCGCFSDRSGVGCSQLLNTGGESSTKNTNYTKDFTYRSVVPSGWASSRAWRANLLVFVSTSDENAAKMTNSRESEGAMRKLTRALILAACFLGEATVAIPDEQVGVNPSAASHLNRGIDWYVKMEPDKALTELNEAIRLDSRSAVAYGWRALVWQDKKDFDRAIVDYDAAIRLDPGRAWAFNNRGNAWAAKRQFARAIADYGEAIRLDPSFAAAYRSRAWIWATCTAEEVRDGRRAVESAMRGCELTDWKDPVFLDTLAAAYAEAGDFEAAVKTEAKAIELSKGFGDRLAAYQEKKRHRGTAELDARLSQARPSEVTSPAMSHSCFIVPYDAMLSLSPAGGLAGAITEFGLGTSEADHRPIFTGLPANPKPDGEVKIGFVAAGSEIHFYEKTEWGGTHWAFSHDANSDAARVAFHDRDNSLGWNGSIIEKIGPTKWLLHLDDAGSFKVDDGDGDVLIEIRLVPAKRPAKP
jgi:tetratricopeptide (TPR) repeat protein